MGNKLGLSCTKIKLWQNELWLQAWLSHTAWQIIHPCYYEAITRYQHHQGSPPFPFLSENIFQLAHTFKLIDPFYLEYVATRNVH